MILQCLFTGFLLGGSNFKFHFSEIQEVGVGCVLDSQRGQLSPPSTSRWGPLDCGDPMGMG